MNNCKYLGSKLVKHGNSDEEIKKKNMGRKKVFEKLRNMLKNSHISISKKRRVANTYMWSVLLSTAVRRGQSV